ncbi:MAG: 2OG-Fe(II) oxygenase, partial [Xanthomonadales bacterium]|nr:2OG-Fe(II) oxygenase [Xanthomonadales bacterium]
CLRFLGKIDDIDSLVAPELVPLYGEIAAFKRCDNSFHGHLPYAGERRVIQVAWLVSEQDKLRKTRRGRFSRGFKKLFGALDRQLGAGRDRNASHSK